MDEATEARDVILALRSYSERIDTIMAQIGDRRSVSQCEKMDLQALLSALKADIKSAAKRNKVRDDRLPQTPAERHYFEPAVRSASANFRISTNSHPINSNWHTCLYGIRIDIDLPLFQLEKHFPEF